MTIVKLDKRSRNALGAEMFAFPRTRSCPINDEHHVLLAWGMVDGVKGVTDVEKIEARSRITARAKELGIDTSEWHRMKSLSLECMALNISHDDDHPNKMPFSGVLTKIDEPSDAAPGGSGGRRIIVTAGAAERALKSLLGMAVDFTPSFDGHDAKSKIGIITSANVVGNELRIEGFVYAADFPDTAELIQKLKDVLGFSFEAQRISVEDPGAEFLRITELVFTGAAILLKDKAAFTTTSLAAAADDNGDLDMDATELKKILDEAVKPLTDRLDKVEAANKVIVSNIEAADKVKAAVEPHAAALEAQATTLEAVGIKADHLRQIAASLRSEAAAGKMPTALAAGTITPAAAATIVPAANDEAVKALIAEALKPVQAELETTKTKLTDAVNKQRLDASAPSRKTLSPAVGAILSRSGVTLPEDGKTLATADVDKLLAAANIAIPQRIMLKTELSRMGALV